MELIGKKKFVAVALNTKYKSFVIYVTALSIDFSNKVHTSKKAQITHLKVDEVSTKVLSKYMNFADVFSLKLAIKLPKYRRINDYVIKLVDD